jgi:hypothetical protein
MIDHVMRSRDGMKIHVVELFDPLGIEYCTFWFYSVVEKARHLFITVSKRKSFSISADKARFRGLNTPTLRGCNRCEVCSSR